MPHDMMIHAHCKIMSVPRVVKLSDMYACTRVYDHDCAFLFQMSQTRISQMDTVSVRSFAFWILYFGFCKQAYCKSLNEMIDNKV